MNAFAFRRTVGISATLTAIAAVALVAAWQAASLRRAAFFTGYVLLVFVVFLALFHLRKKLPGAPIGAAAAWMQTHVYAGLAAIAIFALHVGFRLPTGAFESLLFSLFAATAGSGLFGLYLTRTDPRRLNLPPEEAIWERIPQLREATRQSARKLLVQAAAAGASGVLSDYYVHVAAPLVERPRGWAYRLWPSSRARRTVLSALEAQDRYLNDEERIVKRRLAALIRRQDDLDYQAAVGLRLKAWLFVHLGLTYSLLAAAALHVALVHAFGGGW